MFQVTQFLADLVDKANTSVPEGVEDCVYNDAVVYVGADAAQVKWGGGSDPRTVLEEGATYLVDFVEVHSWHTKVKLVGVEGLFNSVCFTRFQGE